MGIGATNLGATPYCGLIRRTWECVPDKDSETGHRHTPGGEYAPEFQLEQYLLAHAFCPDCGGRFVEWLQEEEIKGFATSGTKVLVLWHYDYSRALAYYMAKN